MRFCAFSCRFASPCNHTAAYNFSMWFLLLQGIGFGFAAAAQPGPFQTYLIAQSLTRGWQRTLPAALAPLVSDGPIIVLCLLVLSQVPAWMTRGLSVAGGAFVLYLAWGTWRVWRRQAPANASTRADVSSNVVAVPERQSVLKAALMNVLSPGPYLFWTLVTGPLLVQAWHQSAAAGIGFLAGFYAAMVLALATIIVVFGLAAAAGPRVRHAMTGVSALALAVFGAYQLVTGLL